MAFKSATVNASLVPASQNNFVAYVDLSRVGITTLAEAQSVRVYLNQSKTLQVAREIVSATEMHVLIPFLTSTTTMYIDYDGVRADYAVTDTFGRNAVWFQYDVVLHGQDANVDSTGKRTMSMTGTVTYTDGKVRRAYNIPDTANYPTAPDATDLRYTGNMYFSAWLKRNAISNRDTPFSKGQPWSSATGYWMHFNDVSNDAYINTPGSSFANTQITTTGVPDLVSAPRHFVFKKTASTNIKTYFSGVLHHTVSTTAAFTTNTNALWVGQRVDGSDQWNGYMDEVRFSSFLFSDNYITIDYNNQNDETSFWGTWSTASETDGWLAGWSYRKQINITDAVGAGTNYQVKLLIAQNTGGNVGLNNNSASFPSGEGLGGDLRFTAANGQTTLSFWVESVSGGIATVWVKVSESLDNPRSIYVYYGNGAASNGSNGENTFILFDDFNDGVIDTGKWTLTNSPTESGGNLNTVAVNAQVESNIGYITTDHNGLAVEFTADANATGHDLGMYFNCSSPSGYIYLLETNYASHGFRISNSGAWGADNIWVGGVTADKRFYRCTITGTEMIGYRWSDALDGAANYQTVSDTLATSFNGATVRLALYGASASYPGGFYDFVRVRKFVNSGPAFKSVGSAETPPVVPSFATRMLMMLGIG